MTDGVPTAPQRRRRRKGRSVLWHGKAVLGAKDLLMHAQQLGDGSFKSGRMGEFVYYMYKGRLRWHRYVVPRDPCTVSQQRARAAFGTASKAWSENGPLTEEQRHDWYAEGAKVECLPRLGCSGRRTGQLHFVGCNSVKKRYGLALLLNPPEGERKNQECRMQKPGSTARVQQQQGFEQTTTGTRGVRDTFASSQRPVARTAGEKYERPVGPAAFRWGSGGGPGALRGGSRKCLGLIHLCRYGTGVVKGAGILGSPTLALRRGEARHTRGCREFWRGG
jgi:hypothetical protein